MKKYRVRVCLFLCLLSAAIILDKQMITAADEPELYARSALLMDASNGRVLYEENGYQSMPNASTTKIMTCILAIEYLQENEDEAKKHPVEVSSYAASMPKVHLGMQKGEQYDLKELLYSLMLESHNDTAVAIAEYIAGDVRCFADKMNEKATQLGCRDTYFVTPNGLDGERDGRAHCTTAYDLGLIAAYAMRNPLFCEIITTRSYCITELLTGRQTQVNNKDAFLDMMEGACGIKTGFTSKAGYCFVGALKKDGNTYIAVVLACGWPPNKTWKWHDTRQLMQYGLSNYEPTCIAESFDYESVRIPVVEGVKDDVKVYLDDGGEQKKKDSLTLLLGRQDQTRIKRKMKKDLMAPVKEGSVVGAEQYFVNGNLYREYKIRTAESVDLRTYFYCLGQVFMLYFIRM